MPERRRRSPGRSLSVRRAGVEAAVVAVAAAGTDPMRAAMRSVLFLLILAAAGCASTPSRPYVMPIGGNDGGAGGSGGGGGGGGGMM
jgi:hypothetical protein